MLIVLILLHHIDTRFDSNINEISGCLFERITEYDGNGGVISISSCITDLQICESTFKNCSVNTNTSFGGAIFFDSGHFELYCVVGVSCTSNQGHFCFLRCQHGCYVDYASIAGSSNEKEGLYSIICSGGYVKMKKSNSSKNYAREASSFAIINPISFYGSFNTISLCHSIISTVLLKIQKAKFWNSNMINCSSSIKGVISLVKGELSLLSIFIENNTKTLFYVENGLIIISGCTIQHTETLMMGSIAMQNLNPKNVSKFILNHYQNEFLKMEHPIENQIAPIALTEPATATKKSSSLLIILIAVGAFILFIVLALYVWHKKPSNVNQVTT